MYRICPHAFMQSRHDSDDKTVTQVSNKPANKLNVRPMRSRRYSVCSSQWKLTQQLIKWALPCVFEMWNYRNPKMRNFNSRNSSVWDRKISSKSEKQENKLAHLKLRTIKRGLGRMLKVHKWGWWEIGKIIYFLHAKWGKRMKIKGI